MKPNFVKWLGVMGALAVSAASAQDAGEVEQLKKELRDMREQMRRMEQKLQGLEQRSSVAAIPTAEPPKAVVPKESTPPVERKGWSPSDPIRIGKGSAYADLGLVGTFAVGGSTADDIEGGTQLGGHDPNQNGFTVQGVELNLQGAVDPYFRANANILFSVDSEGESFLELEEAWMETISLPWNLQLRAGEILTDFGRINTQHPHAWGFVDAPLVSARYLGPDGLRNPGARLGWLAPTPFFTELSLGIQNSQGETAASFRNSGDGHGDAADDDLPYGFRHADNDRGVHGVDDLLFTPRLATSFDLTDSQTLVVGASGAFGPNSSGGGGDTRTQIYGVDAYWKWKPANAQGGFPFVSWQTEAMLRRYDAGAFDWSVEDDGVGDFDEGVLLDSTATTPASLNRETLTDYGLYTQLLYGFRKGWVAGLRFDYLTGALGDYEELGLLVANGSGGTTPAGRDLLRRERWRLSPNLTWYPSEYSKIRLQYNYDDRADVGVDHSVWLQFEFLLGAHAAHQF